MPDTHSSSQSSPDINTSKQFAVVLQNVFRSIDVNPDDVDYRICRRGLQYISGANCVKQMEVFTGVGPNKFEVISAIAEDRSLAFLKPRLTYDTCSKVLIVKMPSALHEAPLNKLKTVLERKLDYLPSHPGQCMVCTNAHMNHSIRFDNSEFVPDMLLSLRDISKWTNEPSMFLLISECAFSQNEAILCDKLKKIIMELPNLVTVMMIVIREDALFNSPQQKSAAWEFFKINQLPLEVTPGATWPLEYFIWVREVRGNLININNSSADSSMRGMLFPEIRMGEVDAMFDKAISMFKDSIILFFEWLGESFETGEIDEAIGWLKISWTDCQGRLTGGMKDMAYDRYQCWLQKYVLPRHKQKLSIKIREQKDQGKEKKKKKKDLIPEKSHPPSPSSSENSKISWLSAPPNGRTSVTTPNGVTSYAPSESYTTSWICLISKAHTTELARKAKPLHVRYKGKSTMKMSLRDMTADTKTLHEERTLVEWRQPDINQLTTGQIAISRLTWEEVSNKKKPTSGELARDTQAMTQVMTQTMTQTMIQTRITIEEIIATIVTMIAGEEDPQLLLVKTREMTRRRNTITDTEGDHKEFTHTEG
ncbi:hypothetical protein BKA83DRAFT_4494566 [Pisolithus microcarpus]|nr:hypothetical protein BKA83DRAFT_4494566 [Pisolithus microcarpus]